MSRLAFPIVIRMSWENLMHDNKFLTAEEVSDRYRGSISVGTLRNWRAMRIGPTFVKVGKAVLYPITELDAWDQKNMVTSVRQSSSAWMSMRITRERAKPLPIAAPI